MLCLGNHLKFMHSFTVLASDVKIYKVLHDLAKEHGPIYTLYIGTYNLINVILFMRRLFTIFVIYHRNNIWFCHEMKIDIENKYITLLNNVI